MNPAPESAQRSTLLLEAVAHYHRLLEDEELAAASYKMLNEGLETNRLIFGGRRLSPYLRPHFITAADWQRIKLVCETIWSALQKVKDAAVQDDAMLDELGVTEIEKVLVRIDPGYSQVSPTARLDSFLTEDTYSFVELNGESPAGIAFANALARQSAGHSSLLAVLEPNLAVKPATVMITKVTIKGAKQAVQMFGPAQYAVSKAVADSLAEGVIPKDQADKLCIVCGVFIHWDAADNAKIYKYNYDATKLAIRRAMRGEPKMDEIISKKDTAHPFEK